MRSKTRCLCVAALTALTAACGGSHGSKPVIGFLLGTLREDRWVRDRDFFVAEAQRLGADAIAQSANNDDATQLAQAEDLLKRGVDVLVIVPTSAQAALTIVQAAHKKNVPVVAYERMILQSDVDMYVATDAGKIGELQAKYLVDRAPKGNYVIIGGAPNDNNSRLLREGQMRVLKPFVDQGAINIVGDEDAADWKPDEALRITEAALTKAHNQVTAVLAPNDGTASGAIQALGAQQLAGKVLVTGQDADLAAVQRVVDGTQSMTIYKPLQRQATEAAKIAVALAKRQGLPRPDTTINNGLKAVPSILIPPVVVDRDNVRQTVIADGFLKEEDVYANRGGGR